MELVPNWLRLRRQYPANPVFIAAVLNFLINVEKLDDALAEAKELINIAPGWYGAWNNAGWVTYRKHVEEGKNYFRRVIALAPDHYIGYFNLACAFAMCGQLKESVASLNEMVADSARLRSLRYATPDLPAILDDPDLQKLVSAPEYQETIAELRDQLKAVAEPN